MLSTGNGAWHPPYCNMADNDRFYYPYDRQSIVVIERCPPFNQPNHSMTSNTQSNRINLPPVWTVTLNHDHLNYLRTPMKQGASRLTAYMNLLTSVADRPTIQQPPYGQPICMEAGQGILSITELAERWKWARGTVRSFLDQLADHGLLTKQPLDRCSVITMTMTWPESEQLYDDTASASNGKLPQPLLDSIAAWFGERLTDDALLSAIGQISYEINSDDCGNSPHRSADVCYEMIRHLVHTSASQPTNLPSVPAASVKADIDRMFNHCLCGQWPLWLGFIKQARQTGLFHPSLVSTAGDGDPYNDCRGIFTSLLNRLDVTTGIESL